MTPLHKIIFSVLLCVCTQVAKTQNIVQLWYPNEVNVLYDCNMKSFVKSIPFTTNSDEVVGLHSFKANSKKFILLYNGKQIQKEDTISLTKANSAMLTVEFKTMPKDQDSLYFGFETTINNNEVFKKGEIQLLHKKYAISNHEISEQKDQIVELSTSCLDSIQVYFPYGGTETSITLHNNPNDTQAPIKSAWFQFGSIKKNYITFSKKDIGKYYVRSISCWTGSGFWLTIK